MQPNYCEEYNRLAKLCWELYDIAQKYNLDDEHMLVQVRFSLLAAMEEIEECY